MPLHIDAFVSIYLHTGWAPPIQKYEIWNAPKSEIFWGLTWRSKEIVTGAFQILDFHIWDDEPVVEHKYSKVSKISKSETLLVPSVLERDTQSVSKTKM